MCVFLHSVSLTDRDQSGVVLIKRYFETSIDSSITVINFCFTLLVLAIPFICHRLILTNFHRLNNSSFQEKYSVILEGNTTDLASSLYTMLFLYRRLCSATILVFLEKWPIFQCMSLMVFSSLYMLYLVSTKPLGSKSENIIELFNEGCIVTVSHLMNLCLNVAMPTNLSDAIGWCLIGVTTLNIVVNLSVVARSSVVEALNAFRQRVAEHKVNRFF